VDENSSPAKTMFYATFGSVVVALEGALIMMFSGGYTDPFIALLFCALVANGASEVVQRMATALQYQTWQGL
jgi:Co/Zn/Cd efflux system component